MSDGALCRIRIAFSMCALVIDVRMLLSSYYVCYCCSLFVLLRWVFVIVVLSCFCVRCVVLCVCVVFVYVVLLCLSRCVSWVVFVLLFVSES